MAARIARTIGPVTATPGQFDGSGVDAKEFYESLLSSCQVHNCAHLKTRHYAVEVAFWWYGDSLWLFETVNLRNGPGVLLRSRHSVLHG